MLPVQKWQSALQQGWTNGQSTARLLLSTLVVAVLLSSCVAAVPPLVPVDGLQQVVTAQQGETEILEFEMAENISRFAFDETKSFDDGMPAHGSTFITQGYLYPKGTLNGTNGVLPDGSPEFPDKVLGEWSCRGWFVGDAAHVTEGAMAITTQIYQFGEEYGNLMLISEGYEVFNGKPFQRAITGGTGPYHNARGTVTQSILGMTEEMAMSYSFTLEVLK